MRKCFKRTIFLLSFLINFISIMIFTSYFVHAYEKPIIYPEIGHSREANITFSKDGKFVLSYSDDGKIIIWNTENGKSLITINANSIINDVKFSSNSKFIVAGLFNGTIKIYEVSTGKEISSLKGHTYKVASISISPDDRYIVSGCVGQVECNEIFIWDIKSKKLLKKLSFEVQDIGEKRAYFSPDGKYIVSGPHNDTLKLWDVTSGKEIRSFKSAGDYFFFASKNTLISMGSNKTIKAIDINIGKTKNIDISELKVNYTSILKTQNEKKIYIILGDAKTLDLSNLKKQNEKSVSYLSKVFNGYIYMELDEAKNNTEITENARKITIPKFHGIVAAIEDATLYQDNKILLAEKSGKIMFLNTLVGGIDIFFNANFEPSSLIISPNKDKLLLGGNNGILKLYDMKSGKEQKTYKKHNKSILSLSLSPDSKYFAVSDYDKNLHLYDLVNSSPNKTFNFKDRIVMKTCFTTDGKQLISLDEEGDIKTLDVKSGKEVKTLSYINKNNWDSEGGFPTFAISGNCKFASFTRGYDEHFKFFDLQTGKIKTFKGKYSIKALSFDGTLLALQDGLDRSIILFNTETGKPLRIFRGHSSALKGILFSKDNKKIMSYGYDDRIIYWDVSTGKELASFISFRDGEWIVITPEGYYNSSLNGHKHLNIRQGNKVYGIDQFYDVFYRPDIVTAKLMGEDISSMITVTIEEAIKNPPPLVEITKIPEKTEQRKAEICYRIKNEGGGIGEVRIFQNGKLIYSDGYYKNIAKAEEKSRRLETINSGVIVADMRAIAIRGRSEPSPIRATLKGDIVEECKQIDTVAGENEISITAFNSQNTVQSYMKTGQFKGNIKADASHLYVLAIGIDKYRESNINLKYAVKDVRDIGRKIIEQASSLYKGENIHYEELLDDKATKGNIMRKVEELSKVIGHGDGFILFVAGHGVLVGNQYYMLTHEYDGIMGEDKMVSSNEIVEMSKKVKALSQLMIFDTCHAGGVDYIVSGLYDARMSVLAKKMGLHIYASASSKQEAIDGYEGNGLYSHVLLRGLNNNKDVDRDKDGLISIIELGEYSKKTTTEISKKLGHSQTPLIINFGKDSPIYAIGKRDVDISVNTKDSPNDNLDVEIKLFLESYFHETKHLDANRLLVFYADEVDYHSLGKIKKSYVLKDKMNYFKKWTYAKYSLEGNPVVNMYDSIISVEFITHFELKGKNKTFIGKSLNNIMLIYDIDKKLKIITEKSKIISRE